MFSEGRFQGVPIPFGNSLASILGPHRASLFFASGPRGLLCPFAAHGLTLHRDLVCPVDQPIEDAIGQGRIADRVVPAFDRQLARDDGRSSAVAVFQDLEEVSPILSTELGQPPIVEDQQIDSSESLEELLVGTIAACNGQVAKQAGHSQVESAFALATGRVSQGASKIGLTDTGLAGDQHVEVFADPLARGQSEDLAFVESSAGSVLATTLFSPDRLEIVHAVSASEAVRLVQTDRRKGEVGAGPKCFSRDTETDADARYAASG